MPPALPPGRYDLSLGVYRRGDLRRLPLAAGGDRLSLGAVRVASQPPLAADRLPLRRRLDATLGGEVKLLGHDLARLDPEGQPAADLLFRPGDRLALTLYWQTDRRLTTDYTVFVHLYPGDGGGGPPRAQSDGQPSGGNYPTTLWQPGEIIADRHILALPSDLVPGRYRLTAGLYQLPTGARLRLPTGEDVVTLDEVVVELTGSRAGR